MFKTILHNLATETFVKSVKELYLTFMVAVSQTGDKERIAILNSRSYNGCIFDLTDTVHLNAFYKKSAMALP